MRALARPAALAPLTIIGATAVLLIAGGMLAPGFLALSNILLLFSLSAYLGIAGIGETEVILTGGIDLSIAWTITGASIVFTGVTQGDDAHLWAGLPAALAVGIGAGFVNGVGVAKLKNHADRHDARHEQRHAGAGADLFAGHALLRGRRLPM